MFTGEHVSTDVAVVEGRARWWRHTVGEPIKDGMFDHWLVLAEQRPDIEAYGGNSIAAHLPDYTGMLNIETIDAKIIEVHLRFADQWPDLYGGRDWVAALVELYAQGQWNFTDFDRRDGYSVVLFGGHGLQYRHPPQDLIDEITKEWAWGPNVPMPDEGARTKMTYFRSTLVTGFPPPLTVPK